MNIVLTSCAVIAMLIVIGEAMYRVGYVRGMGASKEDYDNVVESAKKLADEEGYKRGFSDGERQGYNDGRRYEAIAQHNTAYIASKHGKVYGEEATEV